MDIRKCIVRPVFVLLSCGVVSTATAQAANACELLSEAQVSAAVGEDIKRRVGDDERKSRDSSCTYVGASTEVHLTVRTFKSEPAAIAAFEDVLAGFRREGRAEEPLHGVTMHARYLPSSDGGTIVARLGTSVVRIAADSPKATLVSLARAALARLAELREAN